MEVIRAVKRSTIIGFIVMLFLTTFLVACATEQPDIDAIVGATLTAERAVSDAINTSVASTMQAAPTGTPLPAVSTEPPVVSEQVSEEICPEPMGDLSFLSAGFLAGDRILVTFDKPSGFNPVSPTEAYRLLIRGNEYLCQILNSNFNRIFCSGRPIPPVGSAPVVLQATDGSCVYELPFDDILIPPRPTPTERPGGYY